MSVVFLGFIQPETGTIIPEYSSLNRIGTLQGNASVTDGFLNLDGSGDYVIFPHITDYDLSNVDATIECRVKVNATSGDMNVINKDGVAGASYSQYGIFISNTLKVNLVIGSGNGTSSVQVLTSNSSLVIGKEHHIAVQLGNTLEIWIDGVLDQSATKTATMIDGGKPLLIGYQAGQPATEYFNGTIRDVRITSNQKVYSGAFNPPYLTRVDTVLSFYPTHPEQLKINTLVDMSQNLGFGSLVGSASIGVNGLTLPGGTTSKAVFPADPRFLFGTRDCSFDFRFMITGDSSLNGNNERPAMLMSIDTATSSNPYYGTIYGSIEVLGSNSTTGTGILLNFMSGQPSISWNFTISKNVEHTVQVTRIAGYWFCFYDGVSQGTGQLGTLNFGTSISQVNIGGRTFTPWESTLNGYIKSVVITSGALNTGDYTPTFTLPSWSLETHFLCPVLSYSEHIDPDFNCSFVNTKVISHDKDLYFGGDGKIEGPTKKKTPSANIPVSRKVNLHRQRDGMFIASTWSNEYGRYSFENIDKSEKYYVVAFDHTGEFPSVVASDITPVLS